MGFLVGPLDISTPFSFQLNFIQYLLIEFHSQVLGCVISVVLLITHPGYHSGSFSLSSLLLLSLSSFFVLPLNSLNSLMKSMFILLNSVFWGSSRKLNGKHFYRSGEKILA